MMRRKITPGYLYTLPSVQIEDGARWPLCSTHLVYERLHSLFNRTGEGGRDTGASCSGTGNSVREQAALVSH